MSEAEKRSVHTDALATLGSIIGDGEKRDAIHIAVEPAIAAVRLKPGQDVGFVDGGFATTKKNVGIVDPFLTRNVEEGEHFWLLIYPRQITSLRHVWSHPDFSEAEYASEEVASDDPAAVSRKWIEQFAERLDQTYSRLMSAAEDWVDGENYTYDNSETYKDYYDQFPEFWRHYAVVTGRSPADPSSFFTCSC